MSPGVSNALVLARQASSAEKDIEVKLRIDNQDAAIAKLGVYEPASFALRAGYPTDKTITGGFETEYDNRVVVAPFIFIGGNLEDRLPQDVTLEVREELGQMQHIANPCNWSTPLPGQWSTWWRDGVTHSWIDDGFGAAGPAFVPQPVHPDDPAAWTRVTDMDQMYWAGTTVNQILQHPDEGPGIGLLQHTVQYHLGLARWF